MSTTTMSGSTASQGDGGHLGTCCLPSAWATAEHACLSSLLALSTWEVDVSNKPPCVCHEARQQASLAVAHTLLILLSCSDSMLADTPLLSLCQHTAAFLAVTHTYSAPSYPSAPPRPPNTHPATQSLCQHALLPCCPGWALTASTSCAPSWVRCLVSCRTHTASKRSTTTPSSGLARCAGALQAVCAVFVLGSAVAVRFWAVTVRFWEEDGGQGRWQRRSTAGAAECTVQRPLLCPLPGFFSQASVHLSSAQLYPEGPSSLPQSPLLGNKSIVHEPAYLTLLPPFLWLNVHLAGEQEGDAAGDSPGHVAAAVRRRAALAVH